MKQKQLKLLLATAGMTLVFIACSTKNKGDTDDSGDSANATGGLSNASGGRSSTTLDRDALAANCDGMTVVAGEACTKAELVCQDPVGILCICGGIPAETGEVQGTPQGNCFGSGGFSFGDRDRSNDRSNATGGADTDNAGASADLAWACYLIGHAHENGGEGGQPAMPVDVGGEGGGI